MNRKPNYFDLYIGFINHINSEIEAYTSQIENINNPLGFNFQSENDSYKQDRDQLCDTLNTKISSLISIKQISREIVSDHNSTSKESDDDGYRDALKEICYLKMLADRNLELPSGIIKKS